jgi:hypothetical protein
VTLSHCKFTIVTRCPFCLVSMSSGIC